MSRIEEIEEAINGLEPTEFRRLALWIRERENTLWDQQIDLDSAAGKLDLLFDEADKESAEGLVRKWPDAE